MDPPTWFTATPGDDCRSTAGCRLSGHFLAGLWQPDAQSASAPGFRGDRPRDDHGRRRPGVTIFAMNPLYRADPEREWTMIGAAAYWGDD